jgi:hypothetical protein
MADTDYDDNSAAGIARTAAANIQARYGQQWPEKELSKRVGAMKARHAAGEPWSTAQQALGTDEELKSLTDRAMNKSLANTEKQINQFEHEEQE